MHDSVLRYLVVTGFCRQSERQVMIYETRDLSCAHTETLDVSPAILIPFLDEDSSTLFLSGKGETTIYGYEAGVNILPLNGMNMDRKISILSRK